MTTLTRSKRWGIAGTVAIALAWIAELFELYWTDGYVIREHTPWHPYFTYALALVGIGCFVTAWRQRGRND